MHKDHKNSFWLAIQYISTIVFSLIILKINLSQFGKELFDIWILLSSIWFLGSAIDLGLGTALVKFIAEKFSAHQNDEITDLLSSGFVLFCILGIVIVLVGFVIGYLLYISNENLIRPDYYSTAITVFIFLTAQFYVRYMIILFRSFFEGLSRYALISKITIFQNSLLLVLVVMVSIFNYSLEWLGFFYLVSSVITITIYISFKIISEPDFKIKISKFNYPKIKSLLKFSLAVQGASILSALLDPVIKFIIGVYAPAGNVSLYEIAKRFALSISGLFYHAFRNILPKTSVLLNRTQQKHFFYKEGFSLMRFGTTYSAFTFGTMSILFILIIKEFYGYEQSIIIFMILALAESINNVGYTMYLFLIGIGRIILLIVIQAVNLILTSISLIIGYLILENNYGLLAYFVSVVVANILMLLYLEIKIGIKIMDIIKGVNLKKLIALITSTLVFLFSINFQVLSIVNLSIIFSSVISLIFLNDYWKNFNKFKKIFFGKLS